MGWKMYMYVHTLMPQCKKISCIFNVTW